MFGAKFVHRNERYKPKSLTQGQWGGEYIDYSDPRAHLVLILFFSTQGTKPEILAEGASRLDRFQGATGT